MEGLTRVAPDFAALFRGLASPHMVLDRELRFVDANDAYCRVTERRLDELVGQYIFDLFPEPGESGRMLKDSLERVRDSAQPHSIPLIPYPIQLPITRGGGFELRYWSAVHTPLLDAEGRTAFIVQNTVDVTELQQLKQIAYGPDATPVPGEKDLLQRAQEVQALNQALTRETHGLRDLFMQAPSFMAVLTRPALTFTLVNNAYQQLIGHRQVVGKPLAEALPEVVEQGFVDLLQDVLIRREPHVGRSVPVLLQREPGAPLEERFLDFIFQPMLSETGEAWGAFVEGSDVTDRVRAEAQQKLLLDELNHRVKNTLATVQSIASATLRTAESPAAFREAFQARLLALSATHDLLTATSWRQAGLRELLCGELDHYGRERVSLEGPDAALSPAEAVAVGLIVHELATNAAKYGGLSAPGGRVQVSWRVEDGVLVLDWRELDGPAPPTGPRRRGFGTRLIERSLGGQLRGSAELAFEPQGLTCRLQLPLAVAQG